MSAISNSPFRDLLKTGKHIHLTSSNPAFKEKGGYVGEVLENSFEFNEVTNAYEHYSNISDPPIFRTHMVQLKDILHIKP